jgi:hypothetical protein
MVLGEIEATYMYSANRRANLKALISATAMEDSIAEMRTAMDRAHHEDARGTRLHLPGISQQFRSTFQAAKPKRSPSLPQQQLDLLVELLNKEAGEAVYLPADQLTKQANQLFLHSPVVQCHSIEHVGVRYTPFRRSVGSSHILLSAHAPRTGPSDLPYQPARIHSAFVHERLTRDGTVARDTFCLIQPLLPLDPHEAPLDDYRQFGQVGGSLWSSTFATDLVIIRPSVILCHFARTAMHLQPSENAPKKLYYHIAPLDRVSTHISQPVVEHLLTAAFSSAC